MRLKLVLATALAIVAVTGTLRWWLSREEPVAALPPEEEVAPAPAPAPAPAAPTRAAAPPAPGPAWPPVVPPAQDKTFRKIDDVDPAGDVVAPPAPGDQAPSAEVGSEPPQPVPPEQPRTPEWRLERTQRVMKLMEQRMARLEREIAEARRRGDEETAGRREVMVQRMKLRFTELGSQAAALADAGVAP